jgi:hypothetical protein
LLANTELEHGTYKNHFHAAPAAAAIVPRWLPEPTTSGTQPALVVGIDGEALTTDRDLPHYPKDLVAWARENKDLSQTEVGVPDDTLRCVAGQPCPRVGWWHTPAKPGSHRQFKQGEVMPAVGGDYGATIWQWTEQQ